MSSELKNSGSPKDLVIGLSFETSLFTETIVRSKGGKESKATADAKIEMKVLVDGQLAAPGEVIFDQRQQKLWAKLGGVLDCNDDGDTIITFDEGNLTEEEIGLILDTTAAHPFNFLAYNIGFGSHTIEAFARLSMDGVTVVVEDPANGSANANASASLGKGTLSAWEVHDAAAAE